MDEFVKISFKMTIGTLVDSEIMQLYPLDFARALYNMFADQMSGGTDETPAQVDNSPQSVQTDTSGQGMGLPQGDPWGMQQGMYGQQNPQMGGQMPYDQPPMNEQPSMNAQTPYGQPPMNAQTPYGQPPMNAQTPYGQPPMNTQMPYGQPMNEQPSMNAQMPYGQPSMNAQMPYGQPPMMGGQTPYGQPPMMYGQMPYGQPMMYGQMPYQTQNVNAQAAQFQAFSNNVSPAQQKENIDLIMDVPLEVSVELGRTTKSIKDILEFSPGTIIELNKISGEPVDVIVNGKYVAKGEVVVIEESFAIRVTEIINDHKN
jgi:flagellar motor switch protein FliN/FliY